jgi:hypothetical protein
LTAESTPRYVGAVSENQRIRLLLAILREDWDDVDRRLAQGPPDAEAFLDLVRQCELHPWVHARLEESGRLEGCGEVVATRLGEWRHKCRLDNLLLLARAEQSLDALLAAGVVPVVLKGLDFLHRFYDDFDLRTLDDMDLLVRREDLPAALDALAGAGWQDLPAGRRDHYLRSSHHLPLAGPGPVPVDIEVHWNLVQSGRYRLRPEALFDRAVEHDVAGRKVLRMSDVDTVAHLLLHHFTHYFDRRLKWTVDLRFLFETDGFTWEAVERRVAEWDASAAVGMTVQHLHKVLPEWFPRSVARRFPLAAWRRLLTWPLRSRHPLDLFRGTRSRRVQLFLAAAALERPSRLPGWLLHRRRRDEQPELSPLARAAGTEKGDGLPPASDPP